MHSAYIVSIQRSAVTKAFKGSFAQVRPDDLLASLLTQMVGQYPEIRDIIDDVVIGCAMQEGAQGMNIARMALLLAGLPDRTPGVSVNRLCSSGLQSIAYAAERIGAGHADVMLAGGVESMSFLPFTPERLSFNPRLFAAGPSADLGIAYGMGLTAEVVARRYAVSREDQDHFALESHRRAVQAQGAGQFAAEIWGVEAPLIRPNLATGVIETEVRLVIEDEGPRANTSFEALQKLPAVFEQGGTVTAGNSSQISDGAGITLIVSEKMLKTLNLRPLARFCGFAVTGLAPEEMGMGPVAAIPKVLKQVGISQNELAWIELNEAFAAQALAVSRQLKLDPARVNPLGGAIALGHPLGATGTLRSATVLHGLKKTKGRYGMVSMCIGLGMGAAAVFENLSED
jgi:acetyl-CoA acyltransferase